jgi:cytochrome c biogenesis factor
MGRWSDSSVLELIRDPWLPVVYAGILLMMAGAVFLFILGKSQSGGAEHVA